MRRIEAAWLKETSLQKLLAALSEGGEEARVAGGAVRNALLGQAVSDVDIATTTLPDETIKRAKAAGFKVVLTGYEYGTVTAIAGGQAFEVTTLRADLETDGRHAKVQFGSDWMADAKRRDFTINGIYAKADGEIIDLVDGIKDIESGTLRFIGVASERIEEDYLRILRFFRFFAWYGTGRPDAESLKACVRLKSGLLKLSTERVWSELKKLLAAPDPSRALLWMRQSGVLTTILPESEKWGIDSIHGLIEAERGLSWAPDVLLRLAAMVPPDAERMSALAKRLRLAKHETARLVGWAETPLPTANVMNDAFAKILYRADLTGIEWRLKLALVSARAHVKDDAGALQQTAGFQRLLGQIKAWVQPKFPITGKDLLAQGHQPGERLGALLNTLEDQWIESGFALDRDELLTKAENERS